MIGIRLDALTDAQRANLLPGTRAEERCGVYVTEFWIRADGQWYRIQNGKTTRVPWPALARLTEVYLRGALSTDIDEAPPPSADPPLSAEAKERRAALERIATGNAGASPSEVATARKVLGIKP